MAYSEYGNAPGVHQTGPIVSEYGFRVGSKYDNTEIINQHGQLVAVNPSGGQDYFVDGNVAVTGDGLSWKSPFKTLVEAIAASNASIASSDNRWWARRNRIFLCDDENVADLVAFPAKCDVIGVGSFDANTKPRISGNHAPVNASNYGCRFINVWFLGKSAAAPIVTLTNATSGQQFINCTFQCGTGSTKNTSAILATASPFMKVIGCDFHGPFTTSYISLAAGEAAGTKIVGNTFKGCHATAKGFIVNSGTLSNAAHGPILVAENVIAVTDGLVVDEDADLVHFVNNRFISNAAKGDAAGVGLVDWNVKLVVGNQVVCHDAQGPIPNLAVLS